MKTLQFQDRHFCFSAVGGSDRFAAMPERHISFIFQQMVLVCLHRTRQILSQQLGFEEVMMALLHLGGLMMLLHCLKGKLNLLTVEKA